MLVGKVSEAWLYPCKSMAGAQVDSLNLDAFGAIGDRCWSMLDAETGDIAWGKRFPQIMNLSAAYADAAPTVRVYGDDVPPLLIRMPDGTEVSSDADAAAVVSDYVGTALKLSAVQPPENREHYRWSEPLDEAAIMKILGVAPGEEPPDISIYDQDLIALLTEHFAPPGTYNDMAPIHLVTTASLQHMQSLSGEAFDQRRFRPNFLVETPPDLQGLPEFDWVGQRLRVGEALLRVEAKTVRCSMPARGQHFSDLEANPKIARALYQETGRFMGAYLSVEQAGTVAVGDPVELVD